MMFFQIQNIFEPGFCFLKNHIIIKPIKTKTTATEMHPPSKDVRPRTIGNNMRMALDTRKSI